MKNKLIKRFSSFVLACMMLFALSSMAFAVDSTMDVSEAVTVTENATTVAPLSDARVSTTVSPWETATIWPSLSSYVGLQKSITVVTRVTNSGENGGGILLTLKKSGKIKSNDWVMGINDYGTWTFTLPASGDYELIIYNHSDCSVNVSAQWI